MAELQDHEKALRALWRDIAEKGIEIGVDYPRIVLTLFGDIDALTQERDEWHAICTRQNTALATAEIVAGIPVIRPGRRDGANDGD